MASDLLHRCGMYRLCLVTSCALVLVTAARAQAQPLGALAAQTEAQRKTQPGGGRTFSNDNLPEQSRLEAALRDFELSFDVLNRVGDVQSDLSASRRRSPKLHAYLSSFDNIGATIPSMAEQAGEFIEISNALDRGRFTPFTYEVAVFAIEQAVVDAARSDAELTTLDPARQSRAAFARKWPQTRATQLPRPRPR